jgi:hypothetical protein
MLSRFRCLMVSVACLGAGVTACYDARLSPLDQASQAAGPGTLTASEAAFYLARAQCQHENTCDNVGEGRSFESTDSCVSELTKNVENDLGGVTCPDGIEPLRMRRCAKAIQLERCHSISSAVRMNACAPSAMCADRMANALRVDESGY